MAQRQSRYDAGPDRQYRSSQYGQERGQRQYGADSDYDEYDDERSRDTRMDYDRGRETRWDYERRNQDFDRRESRMQQQDYDRSERGYEGGYTNRAGRAQGYTQRPREFEREQYWNRSEQAAQGYANDMRSRDERAGDMRPYPGSRFGAYDASRRDQERWNTGAPQQRYRGVGPKDYQRSDERLSEQVCERLSDDGDLDASNIEVKVQNGEITLNGTVDSRWAKRRAEDCAESVSGVSNCQNNLRVSNASQQQAQGQQQSRSDTNEITQNRAAKQK